MTNSTNNDVSNPDRTILLSQIIEHFSIDELQALAFELGVDMLFRSKTISARELIIYLERKSQLDQLIYLLKRDRPSVNWYEPKKNDSFSQDVAQLRSLIADYFSEDELRILALNMGIDYESLAGSTKEVRALELIQYVKRRNRLGELVNQLQHLRPMANWSEPNKIKSPDPLVEKAVENAGSKRNARFALLDSLASIVGLIAGILGVISFSSIPNTLTIPSDVVAILGSVISIVVAALLISTLTYRRLKTRSLDRKLMIASLENHEEELLNRVNKDARALLGEM